MEIWRFTNSPEKAKIVLLAISLTIFILPTCKSTIHTNIEGESIELDFPYPCNISRVTFQYGNRAPSYDSADPTSVSFPSNQNLTIKNESQNNECFLYLIISPVSRNDAGAYILTGYEGNGDFIYDTKVGLRVNYPPGKVSCESGGSYMEDWIRLQCSARAGNIPGQIICYQYRVRLPPLTSLEENGGTLNQIILASLEGLVYCCSSSVQETKDMCECKDVGWDPVLNTAITNFTDPCPVVLSSTQVPTISQSHTESETTKPSISSTTKTTPHYENENKNPSASLESVVIISIFLILTCITLIAVLLLKVKQLADLVNERLKVSVGYETVSDETETEKETMSPETETETLCPESAETKTETEAVTFETETRQKTHNHCLETETCLKTPNTA